MFQKITRKSLDVFLEKYVTSERVLDIGSGGSSYDRFFPNRLTVDIDPKRKPEVVADAHSLPFKDGEFNFILCTEVLEHTKDPRKVIEEFKRVLRSGGKIVLTTRFVFPHHDVPHDYWRFTYYCMVDLFKDFEIIEIRQETKTFSTIAVLLQRIAFQSQLVGGKFTKLILFLLAYIFDKLNFLIIKEFGGIKREEKIDGLMSSGFYISCKKK